MVPGAHQEAQVQPYFGGAKSWTCKAFPEENRTSSAPGGRSPILFGRSEKLDLQIVFHRKRHQQRTGRRKSNFIWGERKVGLVERFLKKIVPAAHWETQVQLYFGGAKSWTCGAFPDENDTSSTPGGASPTLCGGSEKLDLWSVS